MCQMAKHLKDFLNNRASLPDFAASFQPWFVGSSGRAIPCFDDNWPTEAEANQIYEVIKKKFQEKDHPTALANTIRSFINVGVPLKNASQLFCKLKTNVPQWQDIPSAEGLIYLPGSSRVDTYPISAFAFPSQTSDPVPMFKCADDAIKNSLKNAAGKCVSVLEQPDGFFRICWAFMSGPFGKELKALLKKKGIISFPNLLGAHGWIGFGFAILCIIVFLSFYIISRFPLILPSISMVRWLLWLSVLGLLSSFWWKGLWIICRKRKNISFTTPDNLCFLVFIENYPKGGVRGNSLGMAFFSACVAAALPWLRRPSLWAQVLNELMIQKRLLGSAAINGNFDSVDGVKQKVAKIKNLNPSDFETVKVIFSFKNLGEFISAWLIEQPVRQLDKIKIKQMNFTAKDKDSGIAVSCLEKLEDFIKSISPYKYSYFLARLCLIAAIPFMFLILPRSLPEPPIIENLWFEPFKPIIFMGKDVLPYVEMKAGEEATLIVVVQAPKAPNPPVLKLISEGRFFIKSDQNLGNTFTEEISHEERKRIKVKMLTEKEMGTKEEVKVDCVATDYWGQESPVESFSLRLKK